MESGTTGTASRNINSTETDAAFGRESKDATVEPEGTIKPEKVSDDDENDEGNGNGNGSTAKQPPPYATNFDGHLPLHWLQPKEPSSRSSGEILPSFRDLQLKTHRTLYGIAEVDDKNDRTCATRRLLPPSRDKSPKGSVDAPIQHLVDLINSHSRFCTLSSCSGRLSLFDPNGTSGGNDVTESNNDTNNNFTEASGKGRGSWVLVSHDPMDPEALVQAMATHKDPPGSTERPKTATMTTRTETEQLEESCCSTQNEGQAECNKGHNSDSDSESDDENDFHDTNPLPSQQPWTFRFEPLLLHVAAASLADGRRLLTVALNLGFRESGLVVTEKRVTVAIRSNSLSTVTPLTPAPDEASWSSSSLCVPNSFLRALVHDANQRLDANWKHLDRLYRSIESVLFEIRSSPPPIVVRKSEAETPRLNLWNASAVATNATVASGFDANASADSSSKTTLQQIWIAGGYGCGPSTSIDVNKNHKHNVNNSITAKRSSKVYQLERELPHGSWRDGCWKEYDRSPRKAGEDGDDNGIGSIVVTFGPDKTQKTKLDVRWFQNEGTAYPDLQGMASCRLNGSDLVIAWGGRKSPARPAPADALYIFDTTTARFGTLTDVRGTLPRSRWGHQLVALDSSDRAVLLGGCNSEDGALDDVSVLHLCTEGEHQGEDGAGTVFAGYFYWEKLSVRLPTPRFHFGASLLNEDTILMMGGLESTTKILQAFENDIESSSPDHWACRFGPSKTKRSKKNGGIIGIKTKTSNVTIETPGSLSQGGGGSTAVFGMACCMLLSNNLLLVTGGTQVAARDEVPIEAFWISSSYGSTGVDRIRMQRIELCFDQGDESLATQPAFDFGSLVHHSCISISDNEVLLVGGGVPSFAFGECYAESHHLVIDVDDDSVRLKSDRAVKQNGIQNSSTKPSQIRNATANSPTPSFQNNAPKNSSFESEQKQRTNVVYVLPKDARRAKNLLQQKGWLDKRFRMIKLIAMKVDHGNQAAGGDSTKQSGPTNEQVIAIPISIPSIEVLAVFDELILRHGEEDLPFSTSQYASKSKQNK